MHCSGHLGNKDREIALQDEWVHQQENVQETKTVVGGGRIGTSNRRPEGFLWEAVLELCFEEPTRV